MTITKENADYLRSKMRLPKMLTPEQVIAKWQHDHRTEDQEKAKSEIDNWTTEQLDEIAKQFKPKVPYNEAWDQEFVGRALALAEMFEHGEEVIIKAKFQDQLPRMFEKMRDSVAERGERMARERQVLVRQDLQIEITKQKLEDHDIQADKLRSQWGNLNHAFKALKMHFRPRIASQTGISFGEYTELSSFAKVKRLQKRNEKLSLDTLVNSTKDFKALVDGKSNRPYEDLMQDFSNQDGIIEMPEHLE